MFAQSFPQKLLCDQWFSSASGWWFPRQPGGHQLDSAPSAPLQGFNQEDLGVVEKESKAQKRQEEESDSDESLERSGQE